MPAAQESLGSIRRLGIFAGGGDMPEKLAISCEIKGIEPFIIAFEGYTLPQLVKGRNHMWTRMGSAGKIMSTLRAHGIRDIVLIGNIKKPRLFDLRPDFKALSILVRTGILMRQGDDNVLSTVRRVLEQEGFAVHGVHKFVDNLLAPESVFGRYEPKKSDWDDIRLGFKASQELGQLDIGQSVIVQGGEILGLEGAEGTDELIRRCKALGKKGRKAILVKTCKPQQDRDLDLPAIGPGTVEAAAAADLAGIAVHAGNTLVLDREKVAEIADRHKIFVIGVDPLKTP